MRRCARSTGSTTCLPRTPRSGTSSSRMKHDQDRRMKIALAGQGAFGVKHLEAVSRIEGIEVASLAGGNAGQTAEVAQKFNIPHWTTDLAESLAQPGGEAVILATPPQMHARQAEQCMRAGKHVMIEIPVADSLADAQRLLQVQKET